MNTARIILEQLGGNRFLAMTGAKNLMADGDSLCMTLPRNASRANRLRVSLNGLDLYDMRFYRQIGGKFNSKTLEFSPIRQTDEVVYNDIYCDQLQTIFTKHTGMYTYL